MSHHDQSTPVAGEYAVTKRDFLHWREKFHRSSSQQEFIIRDDERKQIVMTIHDELGQLLTAIRSISNSTLK